MRIKTPTLVACAALLAAPAGAAFAQPGPTLEVTLDFFRDKIAAQPTMSYVVSSTNPQQSWTNQFNATLSNVIPNPAGCSIAFHWRLVRDGATIQDAEGSLPLSQISDVQVMSRDTELQQSNAADGHPDWTSKTAPLFWVVHAVRGSNDKFNVFNFADESMADRVAKAFAHAAELCGGMKP